MEFCKLRAKKTAKKRRRNDLNTLKEKFVTNLLNNTETIAEIRLILADSAYSLFG